MRSLRKMGVVALEQEELEQQLNEVAAEPVDEGAENLETELLDVADSQEEVESNDEQIEEAGDTIEALESLRLKLVTSLESGGLDRTGADILSGELKGHYKRVGLDMPQAAPALESFGGSTSRIQATQLAIESIGEQAKKIWDAIVVAVQRSIDFIVNLFQKIFLSAEKVEARAKALAERADKTNASGSAPKSFKQLRLVKSLYMGKAVPANDEGAKALAKAADELFGGYAGMLTKLEGAIKYVEGGLKGEQVNWRDAVSEIGTAVTAEGLKPVGGAKGAGFDVSENSEVLRSEELPGGRAVIVVVPGDEKNIKGIKAGVFEFDPKGSAPEKDDVPVLDLSAAKAIAEQVGKIAGGVKARKADLDKAKALKNRLIKVAKGAGKAKEGGEGMAQARELFQGTAKLIDQPFAAFNIYALNTSKALLDHVELSLKAYDGGGAKEEKKEDEKK